VRALLEPIRWRRATPFELQGYFRAEGYFADDHTTFWGCKVR
jgi:hypothetical protein